MTDHFRTRALLSLSVALIALVGRFAAPAPPVRTVDAVARMLGDAVDGHVGPDDFIWEERGGFLHDALIGRHVLFLAADNQQTANPNADLYRARVRLTRSGRPISLYEIHNLTSTPLGDDRNLVARGRQIAFTTSAFGVVQGISLFDLSGDQALQQARTTRQWLAKSMDGWLSTGSCKGATRTEISFDRPPAQVALDLTNDALVMALGQEALPAALDLKTTSLNVGGKDPFGTRAQRIPRTQRPLTLLTHQVIEYWLSPRTANALKPFLLTVARWMHPAKTVREEPLLSASFLEGLPKAKAHNPSTSAVWPPPSLKPLISPALPGEGTWVAAPSPLSSTSDVPSDSNPDSEALESFYETFLRPNPQRHASWVHLMAIDTRQIELRLQAGYTYPTPAIGPHGTGQLPEGPDAENIVAAIGIGAHPPDTALGMVVNEHVFVPPELGGATIAIDTREGQLWGPWPFTNERPPTLHSIYQGMPLSDSNKAQDTRLIERAALCLTKSGLVLHAWSPRGTQEDLRHALDLADCDVSLSLGTAPFPLGFAFLNSRDDKTWDSHPWLSDMSIATQPWTQPSPYSFFYLVQQKPIPTFPLPEGVSWTPDDGFQPQPAWLPSIYTATVVHLGAQVRLLAFSPNRFIYRIRAGAKEISPKDMPVLPKTLSGDEQSKVVAAIGLGTGRRRGALGLAIHGTVGLRIRDQGAVLVAQKSDLKTRLSAGFQTAPDLDATELPLTAEDGKLRPQGREIGSMRPRAAACVALDGSLLLATTTFDSDEATTQALLDLGCLRIVALDRGTHRNAFVQRKTSTDPFETSFEDTTLFVIEAPMLGRGKKLPIP